ncbi:hypothetical protein HB364_10370 [Pseudoflavitalea sp. X16]|uniref:hypothetical protein n=1 Tax=Paraflavitalea devenefica TaxID=2716334 RepID=UPI00141DCF49|nr:hypothetical protein [Paraflavitalea devenefica]NII25488.1 hypothetical protein [Paraflavitalea devenefica]
MKASKHLIPASFIFLFLLLSNPLLANIKPPASSCATLTERKQGGADTVTENNTAPVVTATGGTLACGSPVILHAISSDSGSLFSWAGPDGFTSTLQNPAVTTAGTYTVTVTNPANGYSTTYPVTVTAGSAASTIWLQEFTCSNGTTSGNAPNAWTSSTPSGNFAVKNYEFYVNHIEPGNVEGLWKSETFSIAGKANVTISVAVRSAATNGDALDNSGSGIDYVRLYYKLNNGAEVLFKEYLGTINNNNATFSIGSVSSLSGSTLQIIIRARTTSYYEHYYFDNVMATAESAAPAITTAVTGAITCTGSAQLLTTVTNGTASSYAWTGPNGFTAAIQNPVVSAGGQYTVTATLPGGCILSVPVAVAENKTTPNAAITASGNKLSCIDTSISLAATAAAGINYTWTGTNGYTATGADVAIIAPGEYTLTVTDTANGCSASSGIIITQDIEQPVGISAFNSDKLTCFISSSTLTGNASTPGATFLWTGPGGFTATTRISRASLPGTYYLKVTNPGSGCSRTVHIIVEQDTTPPADISISNNGPLTCDLFEVTLTGSTSSQGVGYTWRSADGEYISTSPEAFVTAPGTYNLTVTNYAGNGCSATVTTTVTQDLTGCDGSDSKKIKSPAVTSIDGDKPFTSFEHTAYPNPFSDRVTIAFRSPGNDFVTVAIFSGAAVQEKVLFNKKVKAGETYQLTLNAGNLPAGIHYCLIKVNGKTYTSKLLLLK